MMFRVSAILTLDRRYRDSDTRRDKGQIGEGPASRLDHSPESGDERARSRAGLRPGDPPRRRTRLAVRGARPRPFDRADVLPRRAYRAVPAPSAGTAAPSLSQSENEQADERPDQGDRRARLCREVPVDAVQFPLGDAERNAEHPESVRHRPSDRQQSDRHVRPPPRPARYRLVDGSDRYALRTTRVRQPGEQDAPVTIASRAPRSRRSEGRPANTAGISKSCG